MRFYYQGKRITGEVETGELEATTREEAIKLLESSGIVVDFIEEIKPSIFEKEIFFERIGEKDRVYFFYQLKTLVGSQVPLVEALKTLAQATKKKILKEKILQIAQEVAAGKKLSEACAQFPEIFSFYHLSLIKIGEETGRLPECLQLLADYVEKISTLKQKILSAILYPALVFVILVGMLYLIFFKLVPRLEPIFSSIESLPLLTWAIVSLSHFLRENKIFFLGIILIGGVYLFFLGERLKKSFSTFLISFPKIGEIFKKVYLARMAFSLFTCHEAGISLIESLTLTAETVGNEIYKKAILDLRSGVEKGFPLSAVLSRYRELFPPVFIQMVLVGEKTGKSRETLAKISQFYEREVETAIQAFLTILEPVLILILAVGVGLVVVGLLVPIYQSIMAGGGETGM